MTETEKKQLRNFGILKVFCFFLSMVSFGAFIVMLLFYEWSSKFAVAMIILQAIGLAGQFMAKNYMRIIKILAG